MEHTQQTPATAAPSSSSSPPSSSAAVSLRVYGICRITARPTRASLVSKANQLSFQEGGKSLLVVAKTTYALLRHPASPKLVLLGACGLLPAIFEILYVSN
ncbi:hypothetical protein K431DRAFT_284808 [Polychaeton citri CBS 116435]|uniref:Uncharacterized protein n=1 Tax=Polychaeton citri CBS 116435 TaxID=1314669 RepID=A0A9P4QAP3_9PEZI|nr:hypothetical protein K431DRAFT_284808 [Polychaeton citri CBS 116435]